MEWRTNLSRHPAGKQQVRGRATGNSLKWLVSHMAAGHLRPRGSCPASPPSLPGLEPVPHHCATLYGRLVGASLHTEAAEVPGSRRPLLGCHRAVAAAAGAREKRCRARMRGRERGRNRGPPRRPQGHREPSGRGWGVAWMAAMGLVPPCKVGLHGWVEQPRQSRGEGEAAGSGAVARRKRSVRCCHGVRRKKMPYVSCVVLECHASYGQKHACPSITHSFGVVSRPICWDSKRY